MTELAPGFHRDPTFEQACRMEVEEKQYAVCVQRLEVFEGELQCRTGLKWPKCKRKENGFFLDMGDA